MKKLLIVLLAVLFIAQPFAWWLVFTSVIPFYKGYDEGLAMICFITAALIMGSLYICIDYIVKED
jgi:hypothetical protein